MKTVTTTANGQSSVIVSHSNCDGYFRRFLKNYHSTYFTESLNTSDYYHNSNSIPENRQTNTFKYYDRKESDMNELNDSQLITRTLSKTSTSSKRYTEFKKLLKNIGKKGI